MKRTVGFNELYRPVAILAAVSTVTAGLYWLVRVGGVQLPFAGGLVANQFGDFSTLPLITVFLLVAGTAVAALRGRLHRRPVTISRRWMVAAPLASGAVQLGNEFAQNWHYWGLRIPLVGSQFDWRDVAAVCLGGAFSAATVTTTRRRRARSSTRSLRVLATCALVVSLAVTTGAAGGGSTGSSGGKKTISVTSVTGITMNAFIAQIGRSKGKLVVRVIYVNPPKGKKKPVYKRLKVTIQYRPFPEADWEPLQGRIPETTGKGITDPVDIEVDSGGGDAAVEGDYRIRVDSIYGQSGGKEVSDGVTKTFRINPDGSVTHIG